jgi:hypothetical protein
MLARSCFCYVKYYTADGKRFLRVQLCNDFSGRAQISHVNEKSPARWSGCFWADLETKQNYSLRVMFLLRG